MQLLTLADTKKLASNNLHELLMIDESRIIDFKWGTVFFYRPKLDDQEITGLAGSLVDKFNGEIHPINENRNLDDQIERYRKQKGYTHVIKFPPIGDLSKMTTLEKVFALFKTKEIYQIKQGLELVKKERLFSIDQFAELCATRTIWPDDNIPIIIANCFNSSFEEYILLNSDLKKIPAEISLFKNDLTQISIYDSLSLEELPQSIIELEHLESILVSTAPIKIIPKDLRSLKKLKNITLINTPFEPEDVNKLLLPNNCEIKISTWLNE